MTLRRGGPVPPATYPQNRAAEGPISTSDEPQAVMPVAVDAERIQTAHEIAQCLEAARALQARLEMLGGRDVDVRVVIQIRNRLATELTGEGG